MKGGHRVEADHSFTGEARQVVAYRGLSGFNTEGPHASFDYCYRILLAHLQISVLLTAEVLVHALKAVFIGPVEGSERRQNFFTQYKVVGSDLVVIHLCRFLSLLFETVLEVDFAEFYMVLRFLAFIVLLSLGPEVTICHKVTFRLVIYHTRLFPSELYEFFTRFTG